MLKDGRRNVGTRRSDFILNDNVDVCLSKECELAVPDRAKASSFGGVVKERQAARNQKVMEGGAVLKI
jgi:hypothetical protein